MGRRRQFGRKAVIAVGVAAAALVSAPQAAFSQHRTFNTTILAEEFRFRAIPSVLPEGTYNTRFWNLGRAPHVVVAINLGSECSGLSEAELIDLFDAGEEATFEACPGINVGGEIFAPGGQRAQGPLVLTPGRNVFVCFVNRHYALGMISSTNVISVG